jgi:hypothetical protein
MWERACVARGFIPVGLQSGPESNIAVFQIHRKQWFDDCFAAERG